MGPSERSALGGQAPALCCYMRFAIAAPQSQPREQWAAPPNARDISVVFIPTFLRPYREGDSNSSKAAAVQAGSPP